MSNADSNALESNTYGAVYWYAISSDSRAALTKTPQNRIVDADIVLWVSVPPSASWR